MSGRIIKVHSHDVNYKGYIRHASKEAPQYEIKSDKTDHIAMQAQRSNAFADDQLCKLGAPASSSPLTPEHHGSATGVRL